MSAPTEPRSPVNLEQQRKRAKDLVRAHGDRRVEAAVRIARHLPRARRMAPADLLAGPFTLSEAQLVVAREAGYPSWPVLKHEAERAAAREALDPEALIDAALAGRDDEVTRALQAYRAAAGQTAAGESPAGQSPTGLPQPRQSIHVAAAALDADAVFALLDADEALADARGGRRNWTPLLYACCTRYRSREPGASAARVAIARRLLDLGADPNAAGRLPGYTDEEWRALDGAVDQAASAELVRMLVSAGANAARAPAVLSHAVRGGDMDVVRLLLEPADGGWYQLIWALVECVRLEKPDMARAIVAHTGSTERSRPTMARYALHEAIRLERDVELIGILVSGDGESDLWDPVLQDIYRYTIRYGHRAAAALFRQLGAADEASVVDRAIGACMTGDRAALRRLIGSPEPSSSSFDRRALRDDDHRMVSWAIQRGHGEAVPLMLEMGLNPNVADNQGDMPLHHAVRAGALETVDVLLRGGAGVDARSFDAETPLELALRLPDADLRERLTTRLLDAGASAGPGPREEEAAAGEDPDVLFERTADAVAFGDLETLRALLDAHPSLVHARSPRPHRATLLNYCGANGTEAPRQRSPANSAAVAQLLLERGSDPNATCRMYGGGVTTMGLMLTSAHPPAAGVDGDIARVLLRFGARLDTGALMGAIEYGLTRSVQAYVEAGAPVDTLFVAAGLGRVDVMEALVARGVDVNERYEASGYSTALHAAATMGQEEAVTWLLDHGADTTPHNRWGAMPENSAWFGGHPELGERIQRHRLGAGGAGA